MFFGIKLKTILLFLQLFYLVTNLFKEGNAKEMKKWAYEIHSSFLVPCAVSCIKLLLLLLYIYVLIN